MKKAFTIIEVLAVITIAGILTAVSVAAFMSLRQQRNIEVVADEIKGIIMETRSYVLARPENLSDASKLEILITRNSPMTIKYYKIGPPPDNIETEISPLAQGITIPENIYGCHNICNSTTYSLVIEASDPSKLGNFVNDGNDLLLGNSDWSVVYKLGVNEYGGVDVQKQ